jgi:hypothetical protein
MKEALILAAKFSWGCKRANDLGITNTLKEYAESNGESHSEEKISESLKKLYSYFYYLIIAESNNIDNPFHLDIVKAYWIGNELLENVKDSVVRKIFKEMELKHDKVILGYVLMPLIKKTGFAHHNFYARHNPECSITISRGYFYHLGVKRIKTTPEDIKNLKKYGGKV